MADLIFINGGSDIRISNLADPVGAQDADTKAARDAADIAIVSQLLGGVDTSNDTLKKLADNIALKAPLASPTFSGTPAAPTPATDNNSTQIATTEFVQKRVGKVITMNITGSVNLDLSSVNNGDILILTQTGNVTAFNYSNERIGLQFEVLVRRTANYTWPWSAWTATKFVTQYGEQIVMTDPTTNGSSPAFSEDQLSFLCTDAGKLRVADGGEWRSN